MGSVLLRVGELSLPFLPILEIDKLSSIKEVLDMCCLPTSTRTDVYKCLFFQ